MGMYEKGVKAACCKGLTKCLKKTGETDYLKITK